MNLENDAIWLIHWLGPNQIFGLKIAWALDYEALENQESVLVKLIVATLHPNHT